MKRTRLLVLVLGIAGPICVNGQAADPGFEVISVRPAEVSNQPFGRVSVLRWEPGRVLAQRITVIALIGQGSVRNFVCEAVDHDTAGLVKRPS
jgi:hypothetical protein